ncbi:unnamed protein product [Ilex paraguariensis]|uniref:Uncharacterized protein n=1 Tax=Ilex paraguariensis TaxID=185542 RepID=A0ABC8UMZ3_9AQUA
MEEANGLADFLASHAVQSEGSADFSGSGALPVARKLVLHQDQCLLPKWRMKKVLVCRKGSEGAHVGN